MEIKEWSYGFKSELYPRNLDLTPVRVNHRKKTTMQWAFSEPDSQGILEKKSLNMLRSVL